MWERLYDEIKDRRYGALFFKMIVACLFVTVVAVKFEDEWQENDYGRYAGTLAALLIVLMAIPVYRWFKSWRQKPKPERRPLSSDEIRTARSKLKRQS